jgi:hypothetical protein
MTRYWIGVASRDHVKAAETGGFCQFCHGRETRVRELSAGDGVVYYSPRERMGEGALIRAFTAIGRVRPGTAYHAEQSGCFHPWRRAIDYQPTKEAPITPLLGQLSFSRENQNWRWLMRQGFLEITRADFDTIAIAMEYRFPSQQSINSQTNGAIPTEIG